MDKDRRGLTLLVGVVGVELGDDEPRELRAQGEYFKASKCLLERKVQPADEILREAVGACRVCVLS